MIPMAEGMTVTRTKNSVRPRLPSGRYAVVVVAIPSPGTQVSNIVDRLGGGGDRV